MHLGWHVGMTWVLAVPAPSSCEPACASGPALLSSCHCSPCACQLRCSSRLCPRAVALCGSHQGFAIAVVGALPLPAGCLRLHGRRPPQMLARLLVLKLEWWVVGPRTPMAARASPWGCPLPAAAMLRAGLPAARESRSAGRAQPGSCLAPRPWLCCRGGTWHADGLNKVKQFVLLCNRLTGNLGAKREEDGELHFLFYICAFLALMVSFMGKNTDQYNVCASF